jgi:hypothetical protein
MNSDGGELEIRPGVSSIDSLMRIGAARRTWISDLSPSQQASINRFQSTREQCSALHRGCEAINGTHIPAQVNPAHTCWTAGALARPVSASSSPAVSFGSCVIPATWPAGGRWRLIHTDARATVLLPVRDLLKN